MAESSLVHELQDVRSPFPRRTLSGYRDAGTQRLYMGSSSHATRLMASGPRQEKRAESATPAPETHGDVS